MESIAAWGGRDPVVRGQLCARSSGGQKYGRGGFSQQQTRGRSARRPGEILQRQRQNLARWKKFRNRRQESGWPRNACGVAEIIWRQWFGPQNRNRQTEREPGGRQSRRQR